MALVAIAICNETEIATLRRHHFHVAPRQLRWSLFPVPIRHPGAALPLPWRAFRLVSCEIYFARRRRVHVRHRELFPAGD